MPRYPVLTAAEVVRILNRHGFRFFRAKGGHRIYVKGSLAVTLLFHPGDLKRKTLKSIIQQSGLTLKEFLDLR